LRTYIYYTLTKLIAIHLFIVASTYSGAGQAPVANFAGAPLSGCSPLIVNFSDLSTGNPTSWNWNFGNGNSSTLRNPSATYFTPGTYTVTLTATNASGSNTMVKSSYITVYEGPTVNFNGSPLSGCFPLTVNFQDLSTPGAGNTNVSWFWDFGNGFTSTARNPSTVYTSSGPYSVTLRVTNDKGCVKVYSVPNYINVNPGVNAAFTNTQPSVCRAPANINFTNTTTGPPTLTYLWDFGDGNTSTSTNPIHTYASNGTFTVTLVAFSTSGCQDTAFGTVVIGSTVTSFTGPAQICINGTASFTNTSTPAPMSSSWNFGDGGTASTLNASHTYTTAGVYTVRLINTYSTCIDSTSATITVNGLPQIDFTAPVTSRCQPPLTVNFQDLTPGAASWQWDFGDGGSSTQQNPTHTYTTYGTFNVKLIVTSTAGCTDSLVKTAFIRVNRATIDVPVLPARGCIPYTITMTPVINSVDMVTSYNWDFGDGGTSTAPNPTYTYTTQGIYTVRLIITTSTGCQDTFLLNQAVRVGTKPVANFTASPLTVCAHQPVQFTDMSAPADEWDWNFGDGATANTQNPTHGYDDTGWFDIRLIAYNSGCADTLIRPMYINVLPPVARFVFTADCSNRLQFSFTDQSIAPLSWSWDFGDGGTSSTQNPVHTFPALGSYDVKLVVTNGGCIDSVTQTVTALDESPDFTADNVSVCKGTSIPFHATSVNFPMIANYFWDFGDGNTANTTNQDISHTYQLAGTYSVTLTITDVNGCTNTITKTNYIRINGPIAGFTTTNANGCVGLTTTFNDVSTTDGLNAIVNWVWDFGDGTVQTFSSPPFQHTYNTLDTFDVKMIITDAAGCKDSVLVATSVITTDPVPIFIAGPIPTCPGAVVNFQNLSTPPGVNSYWEFGDGSTSNNIAPSYAYTTPGIYTVKLRITDTNNCSDSLVRNSYIIVANPVADFQVSDTATSCTPFEVRMTNSSSYFISSFWDFGPGEGTSTLTNPVHYYSTPGTYNIKLVVFSPGGCRDSITKSITVYDTVGSRVDYNPQNGCNFLNVTLSTFTPGPMASYFWDFGDGNTATTTTPSITHVYSTFGSFLPKVIVEDPTGCQIPITGWDTVFVFGADAKFGYNDSLFCDFGTVNFTDSTTYNDPIVNYSWTFGDGGSSGLQHPSHVYNTPGIYDVRLIVRTQQNCLDTMNKVAIIKVVQRPLIDIGGDSVICIRSSINHTGLFIQPDTSVVTWVWNFPNGSSATGQYPPLQTYSQIGTFTIRAIATNSTGCKDTTYQNIYVNPLPTVNMPGQITVQNGFPVTIPAIYSPGTSSWIWSPNTGLSCANCATPDAGPKFNTTYQVYFTDNNGCSNTGTIQILVICKNVNLFIPNTFSPNNDGSNDVFYPRGKGLERVKLLRIFNRWGEVVFEKKDFPVNDASAGWNGTYKGKPPQAGVYVYQAEVFCENGEVITLNGNVALIL
jgi:gliding motility-associated-like protein